MSVAIVNRERIVLRETQFGIISPLMQQVKSENNGDSNFLDNFGSLPVESDRLILKLESDESNETTQSQSQSYGHARDGDSTVNDSFSLKIDSFSSHFTEETRPESLKEELFEDSFFSTPCSFPDSTYPQYLSNHTHSVNLIHIDPFSFCLKGMQSPELVWNCINSFPPSDFPEDKPPHSKIVPTCHRFRDLLLVQTNTQSIARGGNEGACSKSATKFAKNDKLQLKNAKTTKQISNNLPKKRRQFICKVCSAQYFYELAFVHHISKHTSEFECNECTQTYTTQRSLSMHMRVHWKSESNKQPQSKLSKHKYIKQTH